MPISEYAISRPVASKCSGQMGNAALRRDLEFFQAPQLACCG